MKRYVKRLASAALLGIAILSLAACGKSGPNQVNEKKVSFIKDAQSSNQRIWYMAQSDSESDYELSKDTHITQILVTGNGKATVYNMPDDNFSMRDIDKKNDKQIIALAQKKDKEHYKDFIDPKNDIGDTGGYIQTVIKHGEEECKYYKKHPNYLGGNKDPQEILREYRNELNYLKANEAAILKATPKYEKPAPKLLNAKVKTDNSGNDVNFEDITHRRLELEKDSAKLKHLKWFYNGVDVPVYYNYTMTNGFSLIYDKPVKILSEMYTGYTNPANDSDATFLLTKTTNKDTVSDFDKVGTKHVSEEE
ncbi:hypothetical protein [Levilactobacillus tujiorum]|uniref:hypothetical protein n=1 Tax=Levilactobacillus tujiorum TaxID=2912243 RepID=UPI0014569F26|nr:hypothetical protein [Levilactobacillus tujiorum]NLR31627.1 hypothetical protein [Levilactobacillus tujiorum]